MHRLYIDNENALKKGQKQEMWLCFYIVEKKEYLSSTKTKNQEMWLHFYIEDNIGVSIIDSIPHCHTENALKTGKN